MTPALPAGPSGASRVRPAVEPADRAQPSRVKPSRRQFLKVAGMGGTVLGVGGLGSLSWRTVSQGVFDAGRGSAYDAWSEWDSGTGPLALIRAAVLAANPHNSQPWTFRTSSTGIDIYASPTRTIGAMDPYRREQQIGLGCALENLMIAGEARGYALQLTLLSYGNPEHIAHIELGTGAVWQDIQRFKDGMTLDAAGLSPLLTALAKILPSQTREQNDQAWIQQTRDNYVKTAAACGFVVVRDASDTGQRINGGRLYQRLHLSAVDRGLAMQPLNTLTERIDREHAIGAAPRFADAVAALLSRPGWQLLMSFRIGYPTADPSVSPRRPAEARPA